METSENLTEQNTGDLSTLFPVDSLVRISQQPVIKLESQGKNLDSGKKCLESFAKYNHDSALWKTYQRCLSGSLVFS